MDRTVRPATPWIQWLSSLGYLLLLGHASAVTPVILNGFLDIKSRSMEEWNRSDWIELFNPSRQVELGVSRRWEMEPETEFSREKCPSGNATPSTGRASARSAA